MAARASSHARPASGPDRGSRTRTRVPRLPIRSSSSTDRRPWRRAASTSPRKNSTCTHMPWAAGQEEQRVGSLGGRDGTFEGIPGFPGPTAPESVRSPASSRSVTESSGDRRRPSSVTASTLLHALPCAAMRLRQGGAGHALEEGDARRVGHLDGSAGETFGLIEAPVKTGAHRRRDRRRRRRRPTSSQPRRQLLALGEQRIELLLRHPHA